MIQEPTFRAALEVCLSTPHRRPDIFRKIKHSSKHPPPPLPLGFRHKSHFPTRPNKITFLYCLVDPPSPIPTTKTTLASPSPPLPPGDSIHPVIHLLYLNSTSFPATFPYSRPSFVISLLIPSVDGSCGSARHLPLHSLPCLRDTGSGCACH
jgi:hypothetical protein